jgi:hypothetical protein
MKSNGKRAAAGACRRRHIRKTGTSNEGQQVLLPVCPVVRTLKSIVPKLKSKPRRRAKSVLRTSGCGGSSSSIGANGGMAALRKDEIKKIKSSLRAVQGEPIPSNAECNLPTLK